MAFNAARAVRVADRMIKKYGSRCVLRRDTGDRDCQAVPVDITPIERAGKLINPTARVYLVSALELDPPPNAERDSFVTFKPPPNEIVEDRIYRILAPVGSLEAKSRAIYWELQVHERG